MSPPSDGPSETGHDLHAVVRRLYDEIYNAGNYDVVADLFDPEFRSDATSDEFGPAPKIAAIRGYRRTFPDLRFTLDDIIVGASQVAVKWTITGTDTGGWAGRPPTGRTVETWGAENFSFKNGRILSNWVGADWLGLLIQLGVITDPWASAPKPVNRIAPK